jgi:Ca2+-binding RTX toxin-like protein
LAGDKGDVMTGGAGNDDFGVSYVSGDDPVTINDYNPAEDTLSVSHLGTSDLPTSVVEVSSGAMPYLNGEPVALLAGVKAADIDLSKIMQDY